MITIHNLRNEKPRFEYDFKVDRSSLLGNPYYMVSESQRNKVCDEYETWFQIGLSQGWTTSKQIDCLKILAEAYKNYGKLRLFCWCAPKRCHCETIRDYLLK